MTPPTDDQLLASLEWLRGLLENGLDRADNTNFSVAFHAVHNEAVRRGLREPPREWSFETKDEMLDFLRNPPPEVEA